MPLMMYEHSILPRGRKSLTLWDVGIHFQHDAINAKN